MEGLKLSVVNKFQKFFAPDRDNNCQDSDSDGEGAAVASNPTSVRSVGDAVDNFSQKLFERISPYKQVSTHDDDVGRGNSKARKSLRSSIHT